VLLESLAEAASTSFCCCGGSAEPSSACVSVGPVNRQEERKVSAAVHTMIEIDHAPYHGFVLGRGSSLGLKLPVRVPMSLSPSLSKSVRV
jgi:hypothetical protein